MPAVEEMEGLLKPEKEQEEPKEKAALPKEKEEKGEDALYEADGDGDDTTIEDLAEEMGWNPDFQGEDYVSAAEYIRRGGEIQKTMRDHMRSQKSQIQELKQTIDDAKSHYESVYKVQIKSMKKELSRLKELKKEAIEDGNSDRVDELDEQIDELKNIPDEIPKSAQKADPAIAEAFQEWQTKNSWYGNDTELSNYADAQSNLDKYKGLPYPTLLKKVTDDVKAMFPEKFPKTPGTPSPKKKTVESPTNPGNRSHVKKYTRSDLTEEQQRIMRSFVAKGVMSEQEYIDDLVKIGQLGGGR